MLAVARLLPLRAWLYAGALALVLAAVWWAHGVYQSGQEAKARVVELTADLAAVRHTLAVERARAAADLAAVAQEAEEARARQDALDGLLADIDRAPAEADAPVAPVLRDALRSLRK